jgi:uncharacterized protein YbaP (TraB family)
VEAEALSEAQSRQERAMVGLFWRAGLVLLLLLAPQARAETLPPARLFLVERDGTPPSWLFGTMHSSDPAIVALPRAVKVALGRCRIVVGELDMAKENLGEIFLSTLLPAGQTLADLLPAELHRRVLAALEILGLPGYLADRFQPWMAAVMLSFEKEELERQRRGEEALDDLLQRLARARGKDVIGLESAAEQLAIFQNLPLEWQIEYLQMALDYPELVGGSAGAIKGLYLAGDHQAMWDFYSTSMAGELETDFTRYFTEAAIVERNHRMAERLAPILAEGGAFVAVGALHLPGPDGLLTLLQQQGWRVSALP